MLKCDSRLAQSLRVAQSMQQLGMNYIPSVHSRERVLPGLMNDTRKACMWLKAYVWRKACMWLRACSMLGMDDIPCAHSREWVLPSLCWFAIWKG